MAGKPFLSFQRLYPCHFCVFDPVAPALKLPGRKPPPHKSFTIWKIISHFTSHATRLIVPGHPPGKSLRPPEIVANMAEYPRWEFLFPDYINTIFAPTPWTDRQDMPFPAVFRAPGNRHVVNVVMLALFGMVLLPVLQIRQRDKDDPTRRISAYLRLDRFR